LCVKNYFNFTPTFIFSHDKTFASVNCSTGAKKHIYPDTSISGSVSFLVYTKIYLFKSCAWAPVMKNKYSGGLKMEKVTFCRTKTGKGFKIVVDGTWLYVSRKLLLEVVEGDTESCQFSSFEDKE
jgi:hypothetical protein